ncbi:hypothetical protein BGHDH14_bgh00902 [Blumeria hordei DH14]|uniref:Uncharacterized protein n=1 Tax=Blumeria graminis f. sp. hordei (strain DH14) TaxID=546991 RepID=N1JI67_BLUG1|nr:hypothetical protein BGHDH14_bgh00902 [Blumeria hordei DH14]
MVIAPSFPMDGSQVADDEPPHSDNDPYAESSSSNNTVQYHIDMTGFPKPIPIIGGILGYEAKFKREAHHKMLVATRDMGRRLNQDEVNAIAFWLAKRQAITSWGTPIGIAGGIWRAYNTMKTFRFPLWQPDLKFWNMNRFGPLRGLYATICWHTLRYLSYGMSGELMSRLFFGSYAISTASVGAANDPRLKNYITFIRTKIREGGQRSPVSKLPVDSVNTGSAASQDKDMSLSSVIESTFYRDNPEGESQPESFSGMSPQTRFPSTSRTTVEKVQNSPKDTEPYSLDAFLDNTSPADGQDTSSSNNMPNSQMSAWDKIRSGERIERSASSHSARKKSQYKQRHAREDNFFNDNYPYSSAEKISELSREEAQQEFDSRVDQERRGGEFSSGSR